MIKKARQHFYKLIFIPRQFTPPDRIYVYYGGVPLYRQAIYSGDRYVFDLPKNLEEKMLAGRLTADLCYKEPRSCQRETSMPKRTPSSACIVLSDRYE